jgi:hypothetical protein
MSPTTYKMYCGEAHHRIKLARAQYHEKMWFALHMLADARMLSRTSADKCIRIAMDYRRMAKQSLEEIRLIEREGKR